MKISKLFSLFFAIFILHSCSKKSAADFDSDASLFKDYISSFSSGFQSVNSDIRVQLAFNKKDWTLNQELDSDLFEISPSVSGKVVALSQNTIAFIPKNKLDQNTLYQVSLNLSKIADNVPKELEKFNFQKGYAYFTAKKKKEATTYFNKVQNSKEYGSQAKYYLGFMAYEEDNYQEATKQFDQVSGEEKYKEKLSYFQADMNFKLGNFQKAIDLGKAAMAKSNASEKSELNKIIGESYFNLKQYGEALPYLKEYKGKKGKWNNTDFYQLGYTYYQQKDYENAISQFNKIIDGNDFVAQNAYYHLGESYMKTDKKQQALNAFKIASEMDFDKKIQEDANLNYAKISYEIGNSYQSVPDVLSSFLVKYPNSPSKNEIENILINSYITSKNYKEALTLLEKNKNPENRLAYQKVTFYRGLELYTDGNYQEAQKMFVKSLKEQKDAKS